MMTLLLAYAPQNPLAGSKPMKTTTSPNDIRTHLVATYSPSKYTVEETKYKVSNIGRGNIICKDELYNIIFFIIMYVTMSNF
jgi:hypothetical protein